MTLSEELHQMANAARAFGADAVTARFELLMIRVRELERAETTLDAIVSDAQEDEIRRADFSTVGMRVRGGMGA